MQHRQTTIPRMVGTPMVAIIATSSKLDGVIALSCTSSSTLVQNNIMSFGESSPHVASWKKDVMRVRAIKVLLSLRNAEWQCPLVWAVKTSGHSVVSGFSK